MVGYRWGAAEECAARSNVANKGWRVEDVVRGVVQHRLRVAFRRYIMARGRAIGVRMYWQQWCSDGGNMPRGRWTCAVWWRSGVVPGGGRGSAV
jgi:hypothetical protein